MFCANDDECNGLLKLKPMTVAVSHGVVYGRLGVHAMSVPAGWITIARVSTDGKHGI